MWPLPLCTLRVWLTARPFRPIIDVSLRITNYIRLSLVGPLVSSLVLLSWPALGQNKPIITIGTALCGATAKVDSVEVRISATIFAGNRIETGTTGCKIHLSNGALIELHAASSIVVSETGFVLNSGKVGTLGDVTFSAPGARVDFRPASVGSFLQAEFLNNHLVVDVVRGSARLTGRAGNEYYAGLGTGTRMQFSPDANQPAGINLLVSGCLEEEDRRVLLSDRHILAKVELIGSSVPSTRLQVAVNGALQPLPPTTTGVAAQIRVLSERRTSESCGSFVPIMLISGAGAGTLAAILIPGQEPQRISIP